MRRAAQFALISALLALVPFHAEAKPVVATPHQVTTACYYSRIVFTFVGELKPDEPQTRCHFWDERGGPILETTVTCGGTVIEASINVPDGRTFTQGVQATYLEVAPIQCWEFTEHNETTQYVEVPSFTFPCSPLEFQLEIEIKGDAKPKTPTLLGLVCHTRAATARG